MNLDAINKAFSTLIYERSVHHKLSISATYVHQLRYRLKNGLGISTDLKIKLLQKSGWRQSQAIYTRQDLLDILKFYNRSSRAAKDLGFQYILEKWEVSRGK